MQFFLRRIKVWRAEDEAQKKKLEEDWDLLTLVARKACTHRLKKPPLNCMDGFQ